MILFARQAEFSKLLRLSHYKKCEQNKCSFRQYTHVGLSHERRIVKSDA